MNSKLRTVGIVGLIALAAMLGGAGVTYLSQFSQRSALAIDGGGASTVRSSVGKSNELSAAFRQTAKAIRPSVVSISSVRKARVATGKRKVRPELPDELKRFFGDDGFDQFFQFPDGQSPREFEQQGLGSGVIISSEGFILTNNHVVQDADEFTVTLADERALKAELVGTDKPTDLAVLKVKANGLSAAELGDSDALEVGEWVLAVGSPMGLDQTVTAGIISAKGRHVGITQGGYEDFLQTDAAINPGNSGGPLVNLQGEVVGINTAIASRTGGYMGIGFAVPSSIVRTVLDQILKSGKVTRGRIGAAIQDLTDDLAESFHFKGHAGVLIGDVVADSPSAKAGLKQGDIVTKFNGKAVTSANQLRNAVAATKPGTTGELEVYRDGKSTTVSIVIGQLEDKEVAESSHSSGGEVSENLGLTVQTLTPDLAKQLELKDVTKGVVVTEVAAGSLAARVAIRPHDIIVNIGGREIQSAADFREAMKQQSLETGVRMQIIREGVNRYVFLKGKA